MVTVDMRHKLQAKKCLELGDVRTHLNKLQVMREDLASMGGSILDGDFTSIILGSIPPSYDMYIATITATSSLMDKTLSPTNLIDAIRDEADRRTIKNSKSKKEEPDVAFVASQSSDKGKKGGEKSKKAKKGRCFNCKKVGHFVKDCYAKGGGAEGQGPKQKGQDKDKSQEKDKGKGKDSAAKVEEKGSKDDGVWMVTVCGDEGIQNLVDSCGGDTGWTDEEIVAGDDDLVEEVRQVELDHSPEFTDMDTSNDNIFSYINNLDISSVTEDESKSIPDLESH